MYVWPIEQTVQVYKAKLRQFEVMGDVIEYVTFKYPLFASMKDKLFKMTLELLINNLVAHWVVSKGYAEYMKNISQVKVVKMQCILVAV